jgi:hypothetical protein
MIPPSSRLKCVGSGIGFLYCDVLPGNTSCNLWVLDFMLGLCDTSLGGLTINDNTLNVTVLQCTYNIVIILEIFTG